MPGQPRRKPESFYCLTPNGVVQKVEIDAPVGGAFTITRCDDEGDTDHVGEYLEIDHSHSLVFTFDVSTKYAGAKQGVKS